MSKFVETDTKILISQNEEYEILQPDIEDINEIYKNPYKFSYQLDFVTPGNKHWCAISRNT